MDLFEAAHVWGWGKKDPLPNICHICNNENWKSYTLPEED